MATTEATAAAVRRVATGLRAHAFRGRSPNFEREVTDHTAHLVNLQRVNAGVTGRDPGFTVNLNVVHGALRRAWEAVGYWMAERLRSGADVGISERLGHVAVGRDLWWHPADDAASEAAADQALEYFQSSGLPWLEGWTDPATAIERLAAQANRLANPTLAALLVEHPDDRLSAAVADALAALPDAAHYPTNDPFLARVGEDQARLRRWLVDHLRGAT